MRASVPHPEPFSPTLPSRHPHHLFSEPPCSSLLTASSSSSLAPPGSSPGPPSWCTSTLHPRRSTVPRRRPVWQTRLGLPSLPVSRRSQHLGIVHFFVLKAVALTFFPPPPTCVSARWNGVPSAILSLLALFRSERKPAPAKRSLMPRSLSPLGRPGYSVQFSFVERAKEKYRVSQKTLFRFGLCSYRVLQRPTRHKATRAPRPASG